MNKRDQKRMDKTLADLAAKHLGLETLETRKSDSLDFHDLAVWGVKTALEAAYRAGMEAANTSTAHEVIRADGRKVRVSVPRDND